MSRMDVGDRDFGKGRHNGSSSSPESSPRQTKKRSFSPTSDDDDLVIPPIVDDDTPPPPERPLIRQAVAFTWPGPTTTVAAPPALNTYEMVIPTTTGSFKDTLFLPGQEVALPAPASRRRKKQTDGPSKKKKKTNDYGGQTNRFRLNTYVSAAQSESNIPQSPTSTATLRATSATSTASASSPAPTLVSYVGDTAPTAPRGPPIEAVFQPAPSLPRWRVNDQSQEAGPSRLPAVSKRPSPSTNRRPVEASATQDRSSPYYRRDYEKNVTFHEPEARHLSTYQPSNHSGQALGGYETTRPPSRTAGQPATHRHQEERLKEGRRTQRTPLLMLTLLIQDIRSGVTDHQLAEVKVPMKAANDPKDGFWADAKLLGQQLQSSASRIDGPAKVYTLRGKYRQFFLRVSAENRDEFISTHLAIKPDRMLDVVVEELLPPGQLPQPPKIPRDLLARSLSPDSTSASPSPERDLAHLSSQGDRYREHQAFEDHRQHIQESMRRSPSPESNVRGRNPRKGQSQKCKDSPSRGSRSPSAESIPSTLIPEDRFDSPAPGDPPEEVYRLITQAVDLIVQEDDEWATFFEIKAALEPQRAMDVLAQYKFVKRMLDLFAGKKIPFRSFKAKIEPIHITQALKIDDPNFAVACVETLGLLNLYGENGRHYADAQVIGMVQDTSTPAYNAKPIKRLLHLMRDIDKKWKEEHPLAEPPSTEMGDFRTARG